MPVDPRFPEIADFANQLVTLQTNWSLCKPRFRGSFVLEQRRPQLVTLQTASFQ